MPSLKELRSRIRSVKTTKQITRAMQLVAAAKLRQSENAAENGRLYESELDRMLNELPFSLKHRHRWAKTIENPTKRLIIVISSNRGLAGPLNLNVLKQAYQAQKASEKIEAIVIGKKGQEGVARLGIKLIGAYPSPSAHPLLRDITPVASTIIDLMTGGQFDQAQLITTRFRSLSRQEATTEQLWPLINPEPDAPASIEPLLEPDAEQVLESLWKAKLRAHIYQALLESLAAEQAARMLAMQSATENAETILDDLSLTYNGLRQANITSEIAEIAAGAEAVRSTQ